MANNNNFMAYQKVKSIKNMKKLYIIGTVVEFQHLRVRKN